MKSNLICMLITIVAYLILMIVVGILASKKNKDTSDFYLGGRKLGPIVTAMSAEASDMSSYLLMGLPGLALLTGFADVGWTVIGLAIGTYLNWLFVAKRLRIYSQHNGSITIPDFFSNRYHDNKHFLMGISAIIILIFFVPYTASGFSACGKLFQTLFGMNYHAAMILSAVIIIAYTSIGGFLAASTTDLLQSIIMTVALVMVVVFGIVKAGGIDVVMENAKALPGYLSFNHTYDITTNSAKPYNILTICSTLAWGLGYFGMPHILLRFMAIEDSRKIKTSRRIASIWVVISMGIAILIGFIGKTLMTNSTISVLGDNPDNFSAESETVIMKIATLISEHGVVAALFAGLIFAGYSVFHTGGSGMYAGNDLLSDEKILQKLSAYVPQEEFIRLRTCLEEELSALFGGFYHGYLGVDMMICHFPDEAPVYRIHPCVEINLRMNMGVVAWLLTDRYLAADAEGVFRIDYYPLAGQALEEHRQMSASFPLSVENNRVCAGYLPLVPVTPQSRYRAFLLLTLPQ